MHGASDNFQRDRSNEGSLAEAPCFVVRRSQNSVSPFLPSLEFARTSPSSLFLYLSIYVSQNVRLWKLPRKNLLEQAGLECQRIRERDARRSTFLRKLSSPLRFFDRMDNGNSHRSHFPKRFASFGKRLISASLDGHSPLRFTFLSLGTLLS